MVRLCDKGETPVFASKLHGPHHLPSHRGVKRAVAPIRPDADAFKTILAHERLNSDSVVVSATGFTTNNGVKEIIEIGAIACHSSYLGNVNLSYKCQGKDKLRIISFTAPKSALTCIGPIAGTAASTQAVKDDTTNQHRINKKHRRNASVVALPSGH